MPREIEQRDRYLLAAILNEEICVSRNEEERSSWTLNWVWRIATKVMFVSETRVSKVSKVTARVTVLSASNGYCYSCEE